MIHLKLIILIFIFSFYNFLNCFADIHLNFNKITLEDGLTDDRYNDYIYEDSRGFVWISSIDGLNRYDGLSIKNYRFESGMKGANIQSNLFENKNGNIWFTTYEAINCYNAKLDTILNYQIIADNDKVITKGYRAFYLDTIEKSLWVKAGIYIYKWDTKNIGKYERLPEETNAYFFNIGLDADRNLEKIIAYSNTDSVKIIYTNKENQSFKIPNTNISLHLEDSEWLFVNGSSILNFDEKNPSQLLPLNNNKEIIITDIIKYNEDNLITSTKQNGIYIYNWKEGKYLNQWKNSKTDKTSLMSDTPRKLYISPSDYLWTSHKNKGVNFSYLYNNNFDNPIENLTERKVEVISVIEDNDGNIWVGTKNNGIYIFNQNADKIDSFGHPFSAFDKTELRQISKTKNGKLLGITSRSIYQFDLRNKSVNNITSQTDSLLFIYMSSMFFNRDFVSTDKGVLEIFENANGSYEMQHCKELSKYKEYSFVQMYKTKTNRVFIPYKASELWFYETNKDSIKLIKKDISNLEFFGFNESKTIPGIVWAGTSNGLKKINTQNEIISVFTDDSELANGNVYGSIEDDKGILWLTTNKGLWKYDPRQPEVKPIHFEEADGLSGELFSLYHSTLLASNGTIWLGNNKGLVKFHPDSIKIHKEIPKLHLDDLLINDTKSYKKSIEGSVLDLNYDQNTLTFNIKAVNLYKTKQNKIHYQLENYDKKWLQIKNGEKIRYTKIKPGKYILNAYAEDANGHKNGTRELLSFTIEPPWWKTKPYLVLYAILSALITYSLLKWRENYIIEEQTKKAAVEKLKAQAKLEEEANKREIEKIEAQAKLKQQAQKTAIAKLETQVLEVEMKALRAQMNPHFLFNSLNSIKSLILRTKEKEASEYLSKFSTLLRSILNNSEKQKIKLSEEIEALELYTDLEALRFASDFNYQIQMDKTIDSSFIRIPPLILQPFVENAIWHGLLPKTSGNSKLNINIIRNGDFLFFEIEDNGVGRKKASALPKKENKKSMGIEITKKRIKLLNDENDIEIIDLVDNNQQALGTKVVIKLFAPE